MRRSFGIVALIGLVAALGSALAGSVGVEITDRWLTWTSVFAMVAFAGALLSSVAGFRAGARFMVPREVTAGALGIALVIVLAVAMPGHVPEGRPFQVGVRYTVEDGHGNVLHELSAEQFRAARSAENRVGCAVMGVFLYFAVLRLLVPSRVWSLARERRWGDLVGVTTHIRGTDVST
jgi:hypothetical protein